MLLTTGEAVRERDGVVSVRNVSVSQRYTTVLESCICHVSPSGALPPVAPVPPAAGWFPLPPDKAVFAADVQPVLAAFMADSKVSWGLYALRGPITEPARRTDATTRAGTSLNLVPGAIAAHFTVDVFDLAAINGA